MSAELPVGRKGEVIHRQSITERPVMIGRAPGNDVVLTADQVSWHHAVVWLEGGRIWIKDLGSTNGTFMNEERLKAPVIVPPGAKLRLGPTVELRIEGELGAHPVQRELLVLEDRVNGMRFPLLGDRFYIGADETANLRLEEGPARAAVLVVHADGEVLLGTDPDAAAGEAEAAEVASASERFLEVGESFTVQGRTLTLSLSADVRAPTATVERVRYPYRLMVDLQGATGPEAVVEDTLTGARSEIRSSNRAVLLYILARQVLQDRESGEPSGKQGWCNDEDVSSGVWGRNWKTHAGSHLHVLIHRLRNQLKEDRIDPWFIEKKRRHVRVRVDEVVIHE